MQQTVPAPELPEQTPARRTTWWPVALEVVAILVFLALVGAAAGWVWERVWTPPTGVVYRHHWYPDEEGVHGVFSATGWYVTIAVAAGLVAGVVAATVWFRSELATLAAVVAGSLVAAWLMKVVGTSLGPADAQHAAATLRDGAHLAGSLDTAGRSWWIGFPTGAIAGVGGVFLATSGRRRQAVS